MAYFRLNGDTHKVAATAKVFEYATGLASWVTVELGNCQAKTTE